MDAQVNYSGHWGPVTATLDWCEVRLFFMIAGCRLTLRLAGQLSVLALRRGGVQYVFEPFPHLSIPIWRMLVIERVLSSSLFRGVRCSSISVHNPS